MQAQVHRLARTNYAIRAVSFAYAFVIMAALIYERRLPLVSLTYPVLALLIYPHLAWLYARRAADSKRAELNNLLIDAGMLGLVMGEFGLPLWPICGALLAVTVNNAICAGAKRLAYAVLILAGTALVWNFSGRSGIIPETGPFVTALCALGIVAYAASVGLVMHDQNQYLIATRDALRNSEELFRFIAEHAGDLVAVLDEDARIRFISASAKKRFAEERVAEGSDWTLLVDPADRERARRFVSSLIRTRMRAWASFSLVAADGTLVAMDCEGSPEPAARGQVKLLVLVAQERRAPSREAASLPLENLPRADGERSSG
jgi:PAS domain S-box-containing protein